MPACPSGFCPRVISSTLQTNTTFIGEVGWATMKPLSGMRRSFGHVSPSHHSPWCIIGACSDAHYALPSPTNDTQDIIQPSLVNKFVNAITTQHNVLPTNELREYQRKSWGFGTVFECWTEAILFVCQGWILLRRAGGAPLLSQWVRPHLVWKELLRLMMWRWL